MEESRCGDGSEPNKKSDESSEGYRECDCDYVCSAIYCLIGVSRPFEVRIKLMCHTPSLFIFSMCFMLKIKQ